MEETQNNFIKRNPNGTFMKGYSGNAGIYSHKPSFKKYIKDNWERIIARFEELLTNPDIKDSILWDMIKTCFHYVDGKPPLSINFTDTGEGALDPKYLSKKQLQIEIYNCDSQLERQQQLAMEANRSEGNAKVKEVSSGKPRRRRSVTINVTPDKSSEEEKEN